MLKRALSFGGDVRSWVRGEEKDPELQEARPSQFESKRPSFYNEGGGGIKAEPKRPLFYNEGNEGIKTESKRPSFYKKAADTIQANSAGNTQAKRPKFYDDVPHRDSSSLNPSGVNTSQSKRPSFYDEIPSRNNTRRPNTTHQPEQKRALYRPPQIDPIRERLEKKIRAAGGALSRGGGAQQSQPYSSQTQSNSSQRNRTDIYQDSTKLAAGQRKRIESFPNHSLDGPQRNRLGPGLGIKAEFNQAPPKAASIDDKLSKKIRGMGGRDRVGSFKNEGLTPVQRQQTKVQSAGPRKRTIELSDEQKRVINLTVNKGRSIFFTGDAGTGKSYLLREIITLLRKKLSRDQSMSLSNFFFSCCHCSDWHCGV
jgi:hypothetical protein